ncbi:PAS domain S-box protein [Chitinilyticum litopenaei]|uniref:PAS domain S-box protein n=1 Tax=Chitinilyticum litopenaei TaxID=1121276 RepID=UPI00041EAF2F|nr:PAS domain S-box protein [Chitinilyticum litopenaei]
MLLRKHLHKAYLHAGLVLVLGLIVSVLLAWQLARSNHVHLQESLGAEADELAARVLEQFRLYQYGLRGLRGAIITAGDNLDREVVQAYSRTRDPQQEFPGARGFGFIRRVPVADESRFLAEARADGWPEFTLQQLVQHPGERFVIQYLEPVASNMQAIGLDIASEPNRRNAALAALESGEVRLTAPITLVQATGKPEQSFLILLPVYRSGSVPGNAQERYRQGVGWTFAPLLTEEMLAGLRLDPGLFVLRLTDETRGSQVMFYQSVPPGATTADVLTVSRDVEIYGRRWQVALSAQPGFVARLHQPAPLAYFMAGALCSLILACLAGVMTISRQRRKELHAGQQRLADIVASSADGIIGVNQDGEITDWNPAAEQLFGYRADEVIGHWRVDVLAPPELRAEDADILQRVRQGQSVPHFETRRRCRDGRLLDVSLTVSPIFSPQGQVAGASITVRDITRQKDAEARIQLLNANLENEVQLRTAELSRVNLLLGNVLQAATEVSIIAADPRGLITVFNRGAERMLGYRAEELLGRCGPDVLHDPAEVAARGRELSEACGHPVEGIDVFVHRLAAEGAETREWTYLRKDGSAVPVRLAVTAMRDHDGVVTGYLGVGIDISERRKAEALLAASLQTTQAILDTAPNPILTLDQAGRVRSVNPAAERIFGSTAAQMQGEAIARLLPQAAQAGPPLCRLLAADDTQGGGQGLEVQARAADGRVFPVQISLGQMRTDAEPLRVAVLTDLSQQEAQRAALIAARDQLQLAADVAELGVWSWDLADNTLHWNARMFELYAQAESLQETGVRYEHWRERVHPEDVEATEASLHGAVRGECRYEPIFRIVRPDGSVRYIQAGAQIERDAAGNAIRVTGINRDITAQREFEAGLQQAKALADAASAAKSSFLANMSHEIRTPMNAVLGMLQLVGQTELSARQRDYISKAQGAGSVLLGLLNDILDYSKIEAGKLQIDPHPFELENLLRNLAAVLAGSQGERDVELVFDIDPDLPRLLLGDSLRLQQVLTNLAGNALKFTPRGLVQIQVQRLPAEAGEACLRFSVRDNGIGISAEQQARIFDGFTQAEASTSRRYGGTGLGLVISRRLVALMGGELELESAPGEGSCFWFELRLPVADPASQLSLPAAPDHPLYILVAEDNAMVAEQLVRTLAALGWEAVHAPGGLAAVAAVEQARRANRRFDVILMDWKMPDLDGLQAARIIRENSTGETAPLIIMVTAYDQEMLAAALQDEIHPFVDTLTKPVTPQQLLQAISRAVAGLAGDAPGEQGRKPLPLAGMRLLVVEDNALNRQIAGELLVGEGADVTLAEGGIAGVALVLDGDRPFDAVLMDVQMPDIDGLEACRRIRADARFAALPIIAMTANAANSDRIACLAAGMNDHVGKPIDLPQLIAALRRHAGPPVTAGAVPEAGGHADAEIEALASILGRFGGNLALYRSALQRFYPEQQQLLRELAEAVSGGSAEAALHALHTIKGNAGTLGARALAQCAAELEQQLRHADRTALAAYLDDAQRQELERLLQTACAQLQAALPAEAGAGPAAVAGMPDDALWRERLDSLLPLLAASSMQALDLWEGWHPEPAASGDAALQRLGTQLQALDFAAARQTVLDLLARR